MARAGMLQRGRSNGAEGVDDVQRSLELLDKVLSEFDEGDPASLPPLPSLLVAAPSGAAGTGAGATQAPETPADSSAPASSTPDDDSPSLGGHQSEDDGYMSMNGRRAKFALSFRPTEERGEPNTAAGENETAVVKGTNVASPPPPEEAERIISTLLPKVSPGNTASRNLRKHEIQKPCHLELVEVNGTAINTATQTTLPKTRHQRPFGWEKDPAQNVVTTYHLQQPPSAPCRFSSLPYGSRQPGAPLINQAWLPPRQEMKYDRNTTATNPHCIKKSPSTEIPKTSFPLPNSFGFPSEFVCGNKPYNEHPVTIYPGANVPYTKQLHSPTYGLPRNGPLSASYSARTSPHAADNLKKHNSRRDFKSDGEMLSPVHKVPPRTLAGSMEKHREVCRRSVDDPLASKKSYSIATDEEHFSDDSLEEILPPPPPVVITPSKRSSIAWEVSLDDDNLLTPGSTKVIGRRRRKSGDSSTGSIPQKLEDSSSEWNDQDGEYWPPPPLNCSTEDETLSSPFSETEPDPNLPPDIAEINSTGTYVIRRGKNRKQLPTFNKSSNKTSKSSTSNYHNVNNRSNSIDGSNASVSGSTMSGSHNNSGSSINSRLSSDLSITQSRFSAEMNNSPMYSRELMMPNSRYSVDLTIPQNRYGKELTSPKSRLSLDLNNSQERHLSRDFFNDSPKNRKLHMSDKLNRQNVVPNKLSPHNKFTDFKKYSSTFDNIQSLIKESVIEDCVPAPNFEESPADLKIVPPNVVRVVSLPSLSIDCDTMSNSTRQPLITTVEEEEDQDSGEQQSSGSTSPLRKIENNINAILSQGRDQKHFSPHMPKDWDIHKDEYIESLATGINGGYNHSSKERSKRSDIQKSSSHNAIPSQRSAERRERSSYRRNGIQKSTSAKEMPHLLNRQTSSSDSTSSCSEFPVNVQVVEHSFRTHPIPTATSKSSHDFGPLPKSPDSPKLPPLPPSPVQEDDEYSEILQPIDRSRNPKKADTLPTTNSDVYFRIENPPEIPPHRDQTTNSLKTRSMDTGFSKNRRHNGSNKHISSDRRTLPTDISAGGARRRTLQRQNREATPPGSRLNAPLQTSASLPETPIFARGCDVPRTPLRQTAGSMLPKQSNTMNSIQTISGNSTLGGYGRGSTLSGSLMGTGTGVDRTLTGAELLRLAGGPARGWYPKQRHRPASIEHLDHLTASSSGSHHGPLWEGSASRKPLTLPPNLTPKFFHKSPREALRRVTSLLIRKGNNGKESRKEKEAVSPAAHSANGDEHAAQKQRKGFFRSFWKKSRHYSLEHP